MTIEETIAQGIQARNQGDYILAYQIFGDLAKLVLNPPQDATIPLPTMSRVLLYYGQICFILGDYMGAVAYLNENIKLLSQFSDVPKDILDTSEYFRDGCRQALTYHQQGKLFPNYQKFRSQFDLYFQEGAEFFTPFVTHLKEGLAKLTLALVSEEITQVRNNEYNLRFLCKGATINLLFENHTIEMGQMIYKPCIRLNTLNLHEAFRNQEMGSCILTHISRFTTKNHITFHITEVVNRSWAEHLIRQGATLLVEETRPTEITLSLPETMDFFRKAPDPTRYYNTIAEIETMYQFQYTPYSKLSGRTRFWTIQKKALVAHVLNTGIYTPIFEESDYLQLDPNQGAIYQLLRDNFNTVNQMQTEGLIFAYFRQEQDDLYEFLYYQQFIRGIKKNKPHLQTLWEKLVAQDSVVLELDYQLDFNPFFIDCHDYQQIIPPSTPIPPYQQGDIDHIFNCFVNGKLRTPGPGTTGLIQGHLPYIKRENIVNIHPMFYWN